MSQEFDTRQCLGPLVNQIYISQLCDFDERVWEVYRTHARESGAIEPGSRDYLLVRMMYIAEVTSNGTDLLSKSNGVAPSCFDGKTSEMVIFCQA